MKERPRQAPIPVALAMLCLGTIGPAVAQELGDLPDRFRNLQVLPENIERQELLETMKHVAKSLGTKCNTCHDTAANDFASDDIEEKVRAREMMRMVRRINRELFTWPDAPRATCFMCHRGQRKPVTEP